ncbi:MAG: bacteriophage abortive infection AbiH family protein [Clostridia bacterium]|nr:bacteriophage abortive infection AbiH family protein [Clostridia bacterium]
MNILVIGNGFDLAHNLPTRYIDFIDYIHTLVRYSVWHQNLDEIIPTIEYSNSLREIIQEYTLNKPIFSADEANKLVETNYLIKTNYKNNNNNLDRWVDFEKTLSYIIQELNKTPRHRSLPEKILETEISTSEFPKNFYDLFLKAEEFLKSDLNQLILSFEKYICEIVDNKEINCILPDIKNLEQDIDKLISFNYTDTYRKVYKILDDENCHFIHGKADLKRTPEENNMVMGIDDFCDNQEDEYDLKFIEFKKFYQRIAKKTGNKYKKWLEEVNTNAEDIDIRINSMDKTHFPSIQQHIYKSILAEKSNLLNIYFFGHSLDVTDRDIISELILNPFAKTTIYYLNQQVYEQQIMNLIKVIGKDNLIEKTGNGTLEFVKQADPIPRDTELEITSE